MDGTGLRFETMEHGGKYPDTMPQVIKLTGAEGRSAIYVPIRQNGKVVDSLGYVFEPE
jgi:septal ring factor EnvC (AmiA/AmiB activator)